jgi:hypothetical protein
MERDTNLMNILHYLLALHKKPRERISPFDKLSRCSLGYVIYFGEKAQSKVERSANKGKTSTSYNDALITRLD